MPETQTMTIEEKLAISNKACLLLRAGDKEVVLPPYKDNPLASVHG